MNKEDRVIQEIVEIIMEYQDKRNKSKDKPKSRCSHIVTRKRSVLQEWEDYFGNKDKALGGWEG